MKQIKEHILIRLAIILLVASLFVPSVIKFTHVFNHHTHKVCLGEKTTHIHKVDLDCDFHKFNLNHNIAFTCSNISFFNSEELPLKMVSKYHFLSKYQRLHYTLRGPPSLV